MEEKTLRILEYDKVIALLCGYASSEAGRDLCKKLKPQTDLRLIRTLQKNTTDARNRIRKKGYSLSFSGVKDVSESLKRLEISASLSTAELISLSGVLTIADRAVKYDKTDKNGSALSVEDNENDTLSELFSLIEPCFQINREIQRCIIAEDEIADDASPELFSIRKSMAASSEKIRGAMAGALNTYRDNLSDAVITLRDGRYCLPVKADCKGKVPGMVHDASSTGLTLFIEPMSVVKLNNELKELEAEEKKAVEKVLIRLSDELRPYARDIADDIKILKKLDMIFAKALFAEDHFCSEPEISTDRSIDLKRARHPLIDEKKVVPIDIRLGKDFSMLIVTGPNTGGKTVSLKTTGLLVLMGLSGMHIPADEGSVISVFDDIYADIGDEQSIEQSLSTFSAHMKNIVHILNKADSRSLCLFDELGSGTDPEEGAALAMAILDFLHRMETRVIATTHYSEIKIYALETKDVENACCEFDISTLMPTYRLLIGVPGKSNAFAISEKLGLSADIIKDARQHIDAENEKFEDVIQKLNDDRLHTELLRAEAEELKREALDTRNRVKKKEKQLDESREKLINSAKEEAAKILKDAKDTADEAIKNINRLAVSSENMKDADAYREKLRAGIKKNEPGRKLETKGPSKPVSPKKIQIGDVVRVLSLGGMEGTVSSLPDRDGNIFVQVGFMKSKVSVKEIERAENKEPEVQKGKGKFGSKEERVTVKTGFAPKALTVSPEINLIGMTTDEAWPELEKYLDDAYLSGLKNVRVVHGRGTGALKDMVHRRLKALKYVDSYRLGIFGEGDTGVTVVTFR